MGACLYDKDFVKNIKGVKTPTSAFSEKTLLRAPEFRKQHINGYHQTCNNRELTAPVPNHQVNDNAAHVETNGDTSLYIGEDMFDDLMDLEEEYSLLNVCLMPSIYRTIQDSRHFEPQNAPSPILPIQINAKNTNKSHSATTNGNQTSSTAIKQPVFPVQLNSNSNLVKSASNQFNASAKPNGSRDASSSSILNPPPILPNQMINIAPSKQFNSNGFGNQASSVSAANLPNKNNNAPTVTKQEPQILKDIVPPPPVQFNAKSAPASNGQFGGAKPPAHKRDSTGGIIQKGGPLDRTTSLPVSNRMASKSASPPVKEDVADAVKRARPITARGRASPNAGLNRL